MVGGGDSAIEAALALAEQNRVVLSYRKDSFSRLKPKNREKILTAAKQGVLDIKYKSNVIQIEEQQVSLATDGGQQLALPNDLVYIFAGGELPTQFLQKAGVKITRRFGYTMRRH